jgi:hypothetical protein
MQNDTRVIWHDDWPLYLYPEDGYNPDAIDENLLSGPFLLAVRHGLSCDHRHLLIVSTVLSPRLYRTPHSFEENIRLLAERAYAIYTT